jgi:hypothetical protein
MINHKTINWKSETNFFRLDQHDINDNLKNQISILAILVKMIKSSYKLVKCKIINHTSINWKSETNFMRQDLHDINDNFKNQISILAILV